MKTAVATLKSIAPYSQSRKYERHVPKENKETADAYEARTWKNRLHVLDGEIIIPPMAFKICLDDAARFLGVQIPGKGKATYRKHFTSGVLVTDPAHLGIKPEDVHGEWLSMNSDGVRGSGKRVDRCYPLIPEWKADVTYYVLDDQITEDVFEEHLNEAGKFIGIGRFRPQNGGYYGRFVVEKVQWFKGTQIAQGTQAA